MGFCYMAVKQSTFLFDVRGGINQHDKLHVIPDNQLRLAQNVEVRYGGLKKRAGYVKNPTTVMGTSRIGSLYWGRKTDAAKTAYLFGSEGTNVKYWDGSAWVALITGGTAGTRWGYTIARGNIFMTSVNDGFYMWDFISPPGISFVQLLYYEFVIAHVDRIWRVRERDNPSLSAITKVFTNYGAEHMWEIPSTEADQWITGIMKMHNQLHVFTKQDIIRVPGYGPSQWRRNLVDTQAGMWASRSLETFPDGFALYLGINDIYMYPGDIPTAVGRPHIQDILDDINMTYIENACAMKIADEYWLSYTSRSGGGTVNNRTIVINTSASPWAFNGPYTYGFEAATVRRDTTGEIAYFGSTSIGQVYQAKSGTSDDGAAIAIDVQTKSYMLNAVQRQELIDLAIFGEISEGSTVTVKYKIDFASSWTTLGVVGMSASGAHEGYRDDSTSTRTYIFHPIKFPDGTTGRFIQIQLTESSTNAISIHGIEIRHQDAAFRR
uniref:Uncharacterized protein n=1 Tax=viral metagenome TaxID=1070528 RepID=A0A6H1ZJQ2_9ZZZZ